ncbi:MAG: hypothetical protein M1822_007271 [Bathelium mastoideum]|nr:MAG: hypothetical protein M1822_007271 [Bathelium mastoideum]
MACKHIADPQVHPPGPNQSVYREDCTQCFDSIDDPAGLDVCLYCFNGGCTGERQHSLLHYEQTSHSLALNIKRTRKKVKKDEPPQKISKLAIAAETEADRYDYSVEAKCYGCGLNDLDKTQGKLKDVVDGVLKANTFARQEEVKAWEQELIPCEHTLTLHQDAAREIPSQDLGQCSKCELRENLWLCLTCGNLACGRAQYGGIGGRGHGLEHYTETRHPIAVKLGSLTADGTADIYCYACDDEKVDTELVAHLAHWGINIADRQKTEKSLTEMQIEQNLRWEFSMTDQDGKEAKPVFGPGFTGLKNLGNSCYLASIIQSLFSIPEFIQRYYHPEETPPLTSTPAEDLETQLRKVADGLVSGRYSKPDSDVIASHDTPEVPYQKGLAPAMLKHLVGRGHPEFSTMRQQDSFELLLHLLKLITRSPHPAPFEDPVSVFRFVMEQKLQCLSCRRVRYRTDEQENISVAVPINRLPKDSSKMDTSAEDSKEDDKEEFEAVPLKRCLDDFTAPETVELTCPACGSKDGFFKQTLFKTFPRVLAVNARRFELVNWVPTKLDVPVVVGDEPVNFDSYKSPGQQPDEELLPDDADTGSSGGAPKFVPNAEALMMLETMGFPRVRCEKALHATENSDAEAAANWLFQHMEDSDIDVPMDLGGGAAGAVADDPEKMTALEAMGFNGPQARQALKETGGDVERAVEWLFSHPDAEGDFGEAGAADDAPAAPQDNKSVPGSSDLPANFQLQSIVCHKGSSIHAGHYVSFIRKPLPGTKDPVWVLFNDEKVAQATDVEAMKKFAYVYFFRRV